MPPPRLPLAPVATTFFNEAPLVLVDVGASGEPPPEWRALAPIARYLGFDPDQRGLVLRDPFGFRTFEVCPAAAVPVEAPQATVHLTAHPECSSLLEPNEAVLGAYGFADRFRVERTGSLPATTLMAALDARGIGSIDWLKLDVQGLDLALYDSLSPERRSRLLAVDVEPGMLPFYRGEGTFSAAHDRLTGEGFWPARVRFQAFARVGTKTRARWALGESLPGDAGAPTAAEALYLRAADAPCLAEPRALVAAWAIAMVVRQLGHALDLVLVAEERGLPEEVTKPLEAATLGEIARAQRRVGFRLREVAKRLLPPSWRAVLRRLLRGSGS